MISITTKSIQRKHIIVILVTSTLLFLPVVTFSFLIGWDDQIYVLNNYTESGLTLKNIEAIITEFYYGQYAPLNQLFYSIVYEFFGYNPAYFHACSVLLHAANALLVYFFIGKITTRIVPESNSHLIAFFTTILFVIAPINLESVAWIAASKVLIYAFFYLCSLIWYTKYIETNKAKYYYFTVICFILSFSAKEQAMTLPLAMILIDYIYKRNFKSSTTWWEKMPPILLSAIFVLASFQSQGRSILLANDTYGMIDRILLAFYTISEYFTKILIPVNLSYVYPFPFSSEVNPPIWIWLFPICMLCTVYCLRRILIQKHILFGVTFFMIHIIMVSNLISLARYSIVADRYAYIASIGLFWLFAVLFARIFQKEQHKRKLGYILMSITYCLYFIVYTSIHIWVWQDAVTLKEKMRLEIKSRSDYAKPNKFN
ncbi:hypothetical protein [Chryseobacterium sp. ISL-6]|uniref:hypothetical protein n=1 Tax=Chryseobacterium sp. ISL-6 TaxID=2819143 RepID=UPI001BE7A8F5|nr:hypothetical protein [Chryseobacterium sp. ISL-6]MBT2621872.1 hypothetical protein [Chryseobacterium sp. ISL-6]